MVTRKFEKCRTCLGAGLTVEQIKCTAENCGPDCEICKGQGFTESKTMCRVCKGKGKIDVTGPRKINMDGSVIVSTSGEAISCPFLAGDTCVESCACFSIKLSQDMRHYYAVCSHHQPDFIIGEVEIEEQMLESQS